MKRFTLLLLITAALLYSCEEKADKKVTNNNEYNKNVTAKDFEALLQKTEKSLDCCDAPAPANSKRELNLSELVEFNEDIDCYKTNFDKKVKYIIDAQGNKSSLTHITERLSPGQLATLKAEANCNCTTWPALRVHYGIDDSDPSIGYVFKFIYEPVSLVLAATMGDYDDFDVEPNSEGAKYWILNGAQLTEIPYEDQDGNGNDVKTYVDNYKNNVCIQTQANFDICAQAGSGACTKVNTNDGMPNEYPKSIIFPFEEIEHVIWHNQKELLKWLKQQYKNNKDISETDLTEIGGLTYNILYPEGVVFINGIKIHEDGSKKHHIFLKPTFYSDIPRVPDGVFMGKGANLGSLCPPHCMKVQLKVVD